MRIGVGRIVLDFYNNDNLALKHKQLEALCKDLRKKFNLSALEIEDLDEPERCVLGFAAVIPDGWKTKSARGLLENICKTIDQIAFARVVSEDVDLLDFGE